MQVIIWFGSTEEEQRKQTKKWIYNTLQRLYKETRTTMDCYGFPEWMFAKFEKQFGRYQKKIEEAYKIANKERTHDRYYKLSYWTTCAYDWYNTIFVRVAYWHINCKNFMSPDWMSLLQVPETYCYTTEDFNP